MRLTLSAVELDNSIQCRASIDTALVNEYAERMTEGDEFPPIEVFGSKAKCWIGDGWHRVMAALQISADKIDARLNSGGRAEALKHALGANALHGHRRSNADKRRCVEIALREFPKLSSRAVAKLCGVDHKTVEGMRPEAIGEVPQSTRTTSDGRQYPAKRIGFVSAKDDPDSPDYVPAHERAIAAERAAIDLRERKTGRKPSPTPKRNDFERALEDARQWIVRWGHIGALASICDAITACMEQARREAS